MKPKVKVLSLALSMILLFTMGFAQSPEIVEQRSDSVVHPGEDLIEQQSDEDPTAENSEDFDFTVSLRSRLIRREQPAAGYSNGYYSGSADKLYERCLYRIGEHVAGGFLMEKDAGESKIYSFTTKYIVSGCLSGCEKACFRRLPHRERTGIDSMERKGIPEGG